MSSLHIHKTDSTIAIKAMCTIVFCLLSFCWIYWFQADLLAIAQHILSGGQTTYHRLIGALTITAVLLFVQQLVSKIISLGKHSYALTYFPSMLLLAILSDIHPDEQEVFTHQLWLVIAPLLLMVWGAAIWIIRQLYSFDEINERRKILPRQLWINLFELGLMMLCVVWLGNTHAVMHYRAHVEVSLLQEDHAEALRTGAKSHETDARLSMLRIYALSKEGLLGDRLFHYTIKGNSRQLIPLPETLEASSFLLSNDSALQAKMVNDYRLCVLLIDKKVDEFAEELPNYYDTSASLPRHYQEALILYSHLRSNPVINYSDASMDEDWDNFQYIKNQYATLNERKGQLGEHYFGSYWYYYYFENQ